MIIGNGKEIADNIRALKAEVNSLGLVRVTAAQLEDWANVINPDGFFVTGLDARGLVEHLSRRGELTKVLQAACYLYGFELLLDEEVQFRINAVNPKPYQDAVAQWMHECFLPELYGSMTERGDRLLEEVLELLQSHGYDRTRVPTLTEYVYNRPVGEPAQEVGGVMVTLAGYCHVAGISMHKEGQRELERICKPDVMKRIREKQASKNGLHDPLPGGADAIDLHPSYVTVTNGMRGTFCVLLTWNSECGGFYEPMITGETCKDWDDAVAYGKAMAEAEGVEFKA